MFTGLVQRTGRLVSRDTSSERGTLVVDAGTWSRPPEMGESVAVQGACLTLTHMTGAVLSFEVLEETFRRTNLGRRRIGDVVNLERALRLGDALGGHILTGHVDGVGSVTRLERVGRDWAVTVSCGEDLLKAMVPKGSIACDGVSLTIVELLQDAFTVHIIPHTWQETSFSQLKAGDEINLETDVLGKYVRRVLAGGTADRTISWDMLKSAGFLG
ncbi:MAG: riboflavin synthase [Verrucomicrobiota bacterium]